MLMMLILMSAPLSDKLMVAANFTLPDDMVFGQAQVIAITAYRFKSSPSSYSSHSSTLSLTSAVFLSLFESCFICLHSTLFLLGFSTNTLSLYKLFRSSSSNISTTGTQTGQAQIEGQSKLKDGQIFLESEI